MNEATSSVAPAVVLFLLIGAFAVMLGFNSGKKIVGLALLAGAAVPTVIHWTHWFLVTVLPLVEVGLAILIAAAILAAIVKFTLHKRKLTPPGSVQKLSVKRRLEGD